MSEPMIKAPLTEAEFDRLPRFYLGARMPRSAGMRAEDQRRALRAKASSDALLAAIRRTQRQTARADDEHPPG